MALPSWALSTHMAMLERWIDGTFFKKNNRCIPTPVIFLLGSFYVKSFTQVREFQNGHGASVSALCVL